MMIDNYVMVEAGGALQRESQDKVKAGATADMFTGQPLRQSGWWIKPLPSQNRHGLISWVTNRGVRWTLQMVLIV